jgi:hypothetical protein
VQEILARLSHHTINSPIAQINVTLDNNTDTFPLDQALNFDFSHDTNIMSVLTAFGFRQFAKVLPADRIVERELVVSHLVCFVFLQQVLVCCRTNKTRNLLLPVWIWKSSTLLLQSRPLVTTKLSISKVSHSFPSFPHPFLILLLKQPLPLTHTKYRQPNKIHPLHPEPTHHPSAP